MSFDMAAQLRRQLRSVDPNAPRTIETVTEEITHLKRNVFNSVVEIGQRLNEAKELLPHGEWLPWLETRVQFSERTAQKYMAMAREYADNPQLVSDLGSEKAFALLALPKEEREKIAAEGATVDGKTKPAADLTKREVQKLVKERKPEAARPAVCGVRANIWRPLVRGVWPLEGELVLLSKENMMGGVDYQLARCMGGPDDRYPFIDPNDGCSCEELEEFDQWLLLVERRL